MYLTGPLAFISPYYIYLYYCNCYSSGLLSFFQTINVFISNSNIFCPVTFYNVFNGTLPFTTITGDLTTSYSNLNFGNFDDLNFGVVSLSYSNVTVRFEKFKYTIFISFAVVTSLSLISL